MPASILATRSNQLFFTPPAIDTIKEEGWTALLRFLINSRTKRIMFEHTALKYIISENMTSGFVQFLEKAKNAGISIGFHIHPQQLPINEYTPDKDQHLAKCNNNLVIEDGWAYLFKNETSAITFAKNYLETTFSSFYNYRQEIYLDGIKDALYGCSQAWDGSTGTLQDGVERWAFAFYNDSNLLLPTGKYFFFSTVSFADKWFIGTRDFDKNLSPNKNVYDLIADTFTHFIRWFGEDATKHIKEIYKRLLVGWIRFDDNWSASKIYRTWLQYTQLASSLRCPWSVQLTHKTLGLLLKSRAFFNLYVNELNNPVD